MVILRPITLDDLDPLLQLTRLTGFGLTTLPQDATLLRRRIRESLRGFEDLADNDRPRGETYLFVLEDLATGKIAGTSGIVSKVGGFEPFYAYRVETSVHESTTLGVRQEIRVLHLVEQHDGPCEIGSLFLAPDYRKEGNGRLLSLARFLFMAEHQEYFDPVVIAEMRGVVDENGRSPFWDALGHHFFNIDFPKADYLSMVNKKFIADLMPAHPIYIPLLPREAQEVIGQVHEQTKPALKILQSEGFRYAGMVDIFEAGPVERCALSDIRTVRDSVRATIAQTTEQPPTGETFFITNTRQDFRACKGAVAFSADKTVTISREVAAALSVKQGDSVRFISPYGPAVAEENTEESDVSLY